MPLSSNPSQKPKYLSKHQIGVLGENLVANWLESRGWEIIEKRWRCRWGEIDIIAGDISHQPHQPISAPHRYEKIVFVEVKTRSRGSWDAGGLLSIDAQKQAKLLQTAEIFLRDRPDFSDCPCQFDVALVSCQKRSTADDKTSQTNSGSPMTQTVFIKDGMEENSVSQIQTCHSRAGGNPQLLWTSQDRKLLYQLTLDNYISGAFDAARF